MKRNIRKSIIYLIVLAMMLSTQVTALANSQGEDWSMYFKNEEHTLKAEDRVMPDLEKVWSSEGGYFGSNSVVVSNNTIYATEAVLGGKLYAFNLETGELKWVFDHKEDGYPNKSPLVVNGVIYFGTSTGKVFAVKDQESTSEVIWTDEVNGGIAGGITYCDGQIFFSTDRGRIYSLNLNGNEIWSYEVGSDELSTPTISNGNVFVSSGDGYIYSLNMASRDLIWKTKFYEGIFKIDGDYHTATIEGNSVFVATPDGKIAVIDRETGIVQKYLHTGNGIIGTIASDGKRIYALTKEGELYGFAANDGRLVWKKDLETNPGTLALSSPVISSNYIYVGKTSKDYQGELAIINSDDGEIIETQSLSSYGPSSPVISNSYVIVGTQGYGLEVFKGKNVAKEGYVAITSYTDKMLIGSETVLDAVYRNVYGEEESANIDFEIQEVTGSVSFDKDSKLLSAEQLGEINVTAFVYGHKYSKNIDIVDGDEVNEVVMLLNDIELKVNQKIRPDFVAYDNAYKNVVINKAYTVNINNQSGKAKLLSDGNIELLEGGKVEVQVSLPGTDKKFSFKLDIPGEKRHKPKDDKPQDNQPSSSNSENKDNQKEKSSKEDTQIMHTTKLEMFNNEQYAREIRIVTDKDSIYLPKDIFAKAEKEKKVLVLVGNGVEFRISPGLLKKDILEQKDENTNLVISMKKEDEDYRKLIKEVNPDYATTGKILEFKILNGVEEIGTFTEPLEVAIELSKKDLQDKNPKLLGVYYINEDTQMLEYMGGKFNDKDQTIAFKTMHNSKYIVMEYNKEYVDTVNHWAKEDIKTLTAKHIINGIGEDYFAPDKKISRAEFTTILVKMLGLKLENEHINTFTDIKQGEWYSPYVLAANKAGLVNGYDGKFRPNDPVSRQEMAVMLLGILKQTPNEIILENTELDKFNDKEEIDGWAQEAAKAITNLGIINGKEGKYFAPKDRASRAEAVSMLSRLLENIQ